MDSLPADAALPGAVPADALKRRSVHGVAATLFGQVLRFALQFGAQLALARLLPPAEFGLIAMIGPLLNFVWIFNELGLSQATVQRATISQQQLSNLFWVNAAVSTALAGLTCLAAPLIAWFYGEPRLFAITLWLSALLVVGGLGAQQIALLNRHMRFIPLATIDVTCTAVSVAVGIAAAWSGFGYWSLVLMQATNGLTILAMAWSWSRWWPSLPRRHVGTMSLLRFGGHMTGFNLIGFVGANLDMVLIGKFGDRVALGLYDRAFKLIASPMGAISLPVSRVADSLLSRLQASPDRYRRAFLLMLQALLLITVPVVAFIAAMAATLVPFLLGPAWAAAAPIAAAIAIATGFAPLSLSASWLFVSQGRTAEQLRFATARTVLIVTAVLVGLPWGAVGVARSYAVFGLVMHGLPLWGATRRGPVQRNDVVRAAAPFAAGAAAAWLAASAAGAGLAGTLPAALRLALCGASAYLACTATIACFPAGLRLLRELWGLGFAPRAIAARIGA